MINIIVVEIGLKGVLGRGSFWEKLLNLCDNFQIRHFPNLQLIWKLNLAQKAIIETFRLIPHMAISRRGELHPFRLYDDLKTQHITLSFIANIWVHSFNFSIKFCAAIPEKTAWGRQSDSMILTNRRRCTILKNVFHRGLFSGLCDKAQCKMISYHFQHLLKALSSDSQMMPW